VVSNPTLTLVASPQQPDRELEALRDRLALAERRSDELLRAMQAALAADAAGMARPLGWLRDALSAQQLPTAGARPSDFVPLDARDATWGRW
jgi:hypothetical protein